MFVRSNHRAFELSNVRTNEQTRVPRWVRVRPPAHLLPTVVGAQLLVLGLWFSGSAVAPDLAASWGLAHVSWITLAVQLGFVLGTLVVALSGLADRVPPHHVFLGGALLGAAANALLPWTSNAALGLGLRVLTGAALAGVYPIGMKLLASWYARAGASLGLLVAALTLGSGSPFLVRGLGLSTGTVVWTASLLAAAGGIALALVARPGPLLPARSPFRLRMFAAAFRAPDFRASALGYFGHMWELYAFWGLAPLWLVARGIGAADAARLAFVIFLAGAVGAAAGGALSRRVGEARVARVALAGSASCCLASPFFFTASMTWVIPFLAVWGALVVADSAQFSALSARAAPREGVGTALTLQTTIGFAITFGSILLVPLVADALGWRVAFLVLAPGPILGWLAMRRVSTSVPS